MLTPGQMEARRKLPRGCAFGPCERSLDMGGAGCDMCDRVAKLPQPKFGKRGALDDDVDPFDRAAEAEAAAAVKQKARPAAPAAAARKHAPAAHVPAAAVKRRPGKGPQTGSLLEYEPD